MSKHGKNYRAFAEKIGDRKDFQLDEAIQMIKDNLVTKFDNTLEVHMRLGVDPKHADQVVRGNVVLPHGSGKTVRVLVFTKGDNVKAAEEAGADFVGSDEYITKIQEGWLDFDKVVASPDMMPVIGRVARVLGPRGLMPNPKSGTVTPNVAAAVKELKAGKISFRVDKGSNIHATVGKMSFDVQKLNENAKALIDSVVKAKPAASKGEYVKSINVTATMSPGLTLSKAVTR